MKNKRFRKSGERVQQKAHARAQAAKHPAQQWLEKDGWALIGILLILMLGVWYFGFRSQRFVVSEVTISETQFIAQDEVRAAATTYTDSKFLRLVQRNTYWMLREEKMERAITEAFSNTIAFEEVVVTKEFPNKVSISLKERIPSVAWVTTRSGREFTYTVDRYGYVTQYIENRDDLGTAYPVIKDNNREELGIGWHVVSGEYIEYMLAVHEQFEQSTGFATEGYVFPEVECTERQYVAERIFEQELNDEDSPEELKEQQRIIQEQFQAGEITVDESLAALERVKKEFALSQQNDGSNDKEDGEEDSLDTSLSQNDDVERIEWEKVHIPAECDFVVVGHELHVGTNEEQAGFDVYMDTKVEAQVQMNNVRTVVSQSIDDVKAIEYIDVRIPDRVYVQ